MEIAIITGASSGLGKEFVEAVLDKYRSLDEIWLIARRKERMEELAAFYPNQNFRILPLDLSVEESFVEFVRQLKEHKPLVKLLINNAGLAISGPFREADILKQVQMASLNMLAPMILCNLTLDYMQNGKSNIINVCSVSAFAPTLNQVTYSATKSFLLNFSRGLREELKDSGINVLALCPGKMATEMLGNPQKQTAHLSAQAFLPFLDTKKLTRQSLRLVEQGRGVYTPGLAYKAYRAIAKAIPHDIIMKFSKVQ